MPHSVKKSYSALEPPLAVVRTSVFESGVAEILQLRLAWACLGLVAAVVFIYARTFHFGFIDLDDPAAVYENPLVAHGLSRAGLQWAFSATRQPLAYLSHMLDCQWFGLDAGRQHLVNVGLHAANAVLLFLLLARLTRSVWRSWFAATLFAVHPLRVESVAWISRRGDLLAACFGLLALWAYVLYVERRGRWRYAAVVAVFCLALLSGPTAAGLPFAMLLLDWWPLRRSQSDGVRRLIAEKIPLFVCAAGCLSINALGAARAVPNSIPFRFRIAQSCAAYITYLEKFFWPRSLSAFYPALLPGTWVLILTGFLLVLALALTIRHARRRPYLVLGWLWFVAMLVPMFLLVRGEEPFVADRFTYLPLMGLSMAMAWLAADWIGRRRVGYVIALGVLAILSLWSWRQSVYWEDKLAVYRHAVSITTENESMWLSYANALLRDGALDDAETIYRQAILGQPRRAELREAMAQILLRQGRTSEAIAQYREIVRLDPFNASARKHMGEALLLLGASQEAAAHLRIAIAAAPDDPDIPALLRVAGVLSPEDRGSVSVNAGPIEDDVRRPQVIEWRPLNTEQSLEAGAVLAIVLIAFLWPAWGVWTLRRIETVLDTVSRRPVYAMALAGLLPMVVRLLLLPLYPVPEPLIADEFGHLLIADTFVAGRLANPPHPMADHFESIYVLQKPSYTSIYPMAQGLCLAAAKMLGLHPWIGVWFSVGLMCACMYWMLAGWIPPRWALLGALLVAVRLSVLGHWMNTYWGGAVPAIGGALVFGALPRILRGKGARPAVILGVGLAILAQTRPYEGFLVAIPVGAALAVWLIRSRRISLSAKLYRAVLPLAAVLIAAVAFTAYYNWRVTGKPLLLPYLLYQKLYGVPQSFYWRPPVPAGDSVRLPELHDNYLWQLDLYNASQSWRKMAQMMGVKLQSFWTFYLQPAWTLLLIALPLVWRDRRIRFLILALLFVFAGVALYPILLPHYLAPVCGIIIAMLVMCIRHLRHWTWRGRPVGAALAAGVLLLSVTGLITAPAGADLLSVNLVYTKTPRARILQKLEDRGGQHLIIVHYGPNHVFHLGSIYNDANIDNSNVVWARDLGPASNRELIRYYPDRTVWLFNADSPQVHLIPYSAQQ
jgi:tetratricopeptide (TPR) repeat protein